MKISNLILASTAILMCGLGPAEANTLRVPDDFLTIQSAIAFAVNGDTVLVAPGHYFENIDFIGKDITVVSEEGPEVTIIDGNNFGSVVAIVSGEGPAAVLAGFTVQNGNASFGAGVTMLGTSPTIVGNIFDSNHQGGGGFGAGIGGNGSSPVIERNIFRNNTCDSQHLSGVVSLVNGSSPLVLNNIFENNPCRAINFTLPSGAQPNVLNNTIIGNRVGVHVDRRVNSVFQIYGNNIIVGNEIGLEVVFGGEAFNPTWEHNLVFGNDIDYDIILDQTGQNGNISADPMFVNRSLFDPFGGGDYRLSAGSPAIDAGANTFANLPATDFNGYDRVFDGDGDEVAVIDMGVFEFGAGPELQFTGTCPGSVEVTVSGATPGGTVGILVSANEGTYVVPRGSCVGAVFGLDAPTVHQTVIADANGQSATVHTIGAGACGLFLQAGDLTTCAPSNVAQVP